MGKFSLGRTGNILKIITFLQMSKFLQPRLYENRALENQLLNTIIGTHDLMCGCPKPLQHIQHLINQPLCLTTGEDITNAKDTTQEEDIGFSTGDLEKLFENDDETG